MITTQASAAIQLVTPFPLELHGMLHRWMLEFPERTLDDFWPRNPQAFSDAIEARSIAEKTFLVTEDEKPVGFIGYCRITSHLGSLRGVCFTREVHGNGTAVRVVRKLLQCEFDEGVHKIMAFPFTDNLRAIAFYKKLGAIKEGTLAKHTIRGGKVTDLLAMAFFAPADGYRSLA